MGGCVMDGPVSFLEKEPYNISCTILLFIPILWFWQNLKRRLRRNPYLTKRGRVSLCPPRSFPMVALKRQRVLSTASMILLVHPLRSFCCKKSEVPPSTGSWFPVKIPSVYLSMGKKMRFSCFNEQVLATFVLYAVYFDNSHA